jgi:hypothetical protein
MKKKRDLQQPKPEMETDITAIGTRLTAKRIPQLKGARPERKASHIKQSFLSKPRILLKTFGNETYLRETIRISLLDT